MTDFPDWQKPASTVADVSDRPARQVGHVSVDAMPAGGVDVTDRAGRAVGQVSPAAGSAWDIIDRVARVLGVADVSDRAARLLGLVGPAAGSTWDISDRLARVLGVADVSDRAGRLLGVADVSDRAARALGAVSAAAGSTWDVSDRVARLLGITTTPPEWSSFHAPGLNTIATITRAAVAGQRHTCRGIAAKLYSSVGAAGGADWVLRDGAAGVGTILTQGTLVIGAASGASDRAELFPLNVQGSVNTAMTLEFTAAAGPNTGERVQLIGFTA